MGNLLAVGAGRVWYLVCLVVLEAITADAMSTLRVTTDASGMLTDESVALCTSLFGQDLDRLEPGQHCLIRLCTENPGVTTMHASRLTTLKHELVRV